ncbi:FxSxx-COOH system tetratricopeptide repeat protein [Streptomyces sp. NBC_01283]|uniref:FxSxx-COOH system tetratricopeptide repeat protein n=1 Tax=Streptomyces sp. NBC_01283 TaxID=2903812 RepID=UPI00352D8DAF|nr:FxSxx-COOH system tetratricopeptide repeat protein [Streptomyces sp. NBC_01283]
MDELAEQPESAVGEELAPTQFEEAGGSVLKPIPPHVAPECRELAEALRSLFVGLRISVRRYAVRAHYDPGTVSRYLNGTAVAPAEFIDRLLTDAAEALRRPVSVQVTDRVTVLQRTALKATSKLGYELQVLKDLLVHADRKLRSAEANVEALSDVLLDKKRRIAEMDAEKQRLRLSFTVQQNEGRQELESLHAAHHRLLEERDRLLSDVSQLRGALDQAQRQAIEAEQRCETLEHQMLAAEESLAVEVEARSGTDPSRFTISYTGPDRPWAVWIRHRLETIGHDAAIQSWDPPIGLSLQEALRSLLVVDGTHILLLSEEFVLAGGHTEDGWAQALRAATPSVQPQRLTAFTLTDREFPHLAAALPSTRLLGTDADDDERRVLQRLTIDPGLGGVKTGASAPRYPAEPPPVWGDVPRRNPHFTGRGAQLGQLRHWLDEAPPGAAMAALVGMPAIGKTQLAAEYAHRFAAQYDVVWWVLAGTREEFRQGLAAIAPALGVDGAGEGMDAADGRMDAILRALRRGTPYGRWLLVLDGAGEPADIAGSLPDGPGHILITSQNSDWAEHQVETMRVLPLDRPESILLIHRRIPRMKPSQADRLADELGDHPLAIAQALAYLDHTRIPVTEYLDRLRDTSWERAPLRATGDYPTTFSHALLAVLRRLRESSSEAVDLLHVCVLFADSGAPLGLLRLSLPEPLRGQSLDAPRWQELVGTIVAHSLADLEYNEESDETLETPSATLRMHPLVRRVVRDDMAGGYRSTLLHRVRHALAAADPRDPENVRAWPQYAQIVPHLEPSAAPGAAIAEDSGLILNCARYLHLRGESRSALYLIERVERAWTNRLGDDIPPQAHHLAARHGEVLRGLGHYRRALESDRAEQARLRAAERPECADPIETTGDVAADLRGLGHYEDALEQARTACRGREDLHGPSHPCTLRAVVSVADTLRLLGRYSEALSLDRRALAGYQSLAEPLHMDSLIAEARHAMDLRLLGHYENALAQQLQATHGYRELLGFENPATLCAEHHLALCELRNDAVGEGLTRLREVRQAADELLGPNSPLALRATTSLAAAERSHGDLDDGTALCHDVANRYRCLLGPEHPYTAGALMNQSVALRMGGDTPGAVTLGEQARTTAAACLGPHHPWTLGIAYNLASDLGHHGRYEASLALARSTAREATAALGPRHPQTLLARVAFAAQLDSTGSHKEAAVLQARALADLTQTLGGQHRLTTAAHAHSHPVWTFDPLPT